MKILTVMLLLIMSIAVIVAAQETPVSSILANVKAAAREYADAVYLRNDDTIQARSGGTYQKLFTEQFCC